MKSWAADPTRPQIGESVDEGACFCARRCVQREEDERIGGK